MINIIRRYVVPNIFAVGMCVFASSVMAFDLGGMLKQVEQAAKQQEPQGQPVQQQQQRQQEQVKTPSPAEKFKENVVKRQQSQAQEESSNSNIIDYIGSGQSVEKTKTPIEIKGIRLGMNIEDVKKIVLANSSPDARSCAVRNWDTDSELVVMGDNVFVCNKTFQLFGSKLEFFRAFFYDKKLIYLETGSLYQENDNKTLDILTSLWGKFGSTVRNVDKMPQGRMGNMFAIHSGFIDENNAELHITGEEEGDMSGAIFKNVRLQMHDTAFKEFQKKREADRLKLIESIQKKQEQKKASDL